jgi:hypothetical protein
MFPNFVCSALCRTRAPTSPISPGKHCTFGDWGIVRRRQYLASRAIIDDLSAMLDCSPDVFAL